MPRRLPRPVVLVAALAAGAALSAAPLAQAASGRPVVKRSYRQTPDAYAQRFRTPVAPGVDLGGYSSSATGGTAHSDVLTVDLTHPGVSTGVLSNRVTDIAPVGTWAQRFGAVAAVNGDYYDISASQAPQGAVVRNGVLQKGLRAGQSMTGLGTDGSLRIGNVYLDGTVTWGKRSHPLDVYDSSLTGVMPKDGLAVLDGNWGNSPLQFVHAPKKTSVAVVGGNHKVITTYGKLPPRLTVPPHAMLLVGTGVNAVIASLKKGAVVTDQIGMHTDAPAPFRWGLGAGLLLMQDGHVIHNYPDDTDPHAARTAIGWRDQGRTMILVTAERGGGSVGEGVNEIADEMAAAGAEDGVLLDGGGSTTLMAREQGQPASSQIGSLQDGFQRPVPIGIGVFVPRGSGQPAGFATGLDAGTVFPGMHRLVKLNAWDEWYGPATIDPASATLSTDNDGLLQPTGTGVIQALRTGRGHVVASAPVTAPGSSSPFTASSYLQVLDPLQSLALPGAARLTPGGTVNVPVIGNDDNGDTAPILARDLALNYDHSLLSVGEAPDGTLSIHALNVPEGPVTTLSVSAGGVSQNLVVHIGFATLPLANPGSAGALRVTGGTAKTVALAPGVYGLSIVPTAQTATATLTPAAPLPAGTARIGVTVSGDGQKHPLSAVLVSGGRQLRLPLGVVIGKKQQRFEVGVPAGATLAAVTVGKATGKHGGKVTITQIVART